MDGRSESRTRRSAAAIAAAGSRPTRRAWRRRTQGALPGSRGVSYGLRDHEEFVAAATLDAVLRRLAPFDAKPVSFEPLARVVACGRIGRAARAIVRVEDAEER